jgi:hypothetical protein
MKERLFGKETAAYVLAFCIVGMWLTLIYLGRDEAPTLTNVIMIIIGYVYGSSTANKSKDDTITALVTGTGTGGPSAAVVAAAKEAAPAAAQAAAPAAAKEAAPPAADVAAPPAAEIAVEHALAERDQEHKP